jgi:hypothetical protein
MPWLNQRDLNNVVVHGSTAISAPPSAVGPNQHTGLYGKWLIASLIGTSALDTVRGEYVAIPGSEALSAQRRGRSVFSPRR